MWPMTTAVSRSGVHLPDEPSRDALAAVEEDGRGAGPDEETGRRGVRLGRGGSAAEDRETQRRVGWRAARAWTDDAWFTGPW